MTKFVIGTATNSHFFLQTQQMLYSLHCLIPDGFDVMIFDNGLTTREWAILQSNFGFCNKRIFKKELTSWERKSYYFKTHSHQMALENYKDHIYIWLDSKTNLKYNHTQLEELLERQPVYGHNPFNQAEELWTDERTMSLMALNEEDRLSHQIQASAMLFDLRNLEGRQFLENLVDLNGVKELITPEGSNKGYEPPTHRQDQSVFSCLLKKYGYKDNSYNWASMHQTLFQ